MTLILIGIPLVTAILVGAIVKLRYGLAKAVMAVIGTLLLSGVAWVLLMAFALRGMG